MRQFWNVFSHEYSRHVFRWRFLLALITLPGIALVTVIFGMLLLLTMFDRKPAGFVDHSGLFAGTTKTIHSQGLIPWDFVPYPDEVTARSALQREKIQAYYVLPPDFRQTRRLELYYQKKPWVFMGSEFASVLRIKFLDGYPTEDVELMASPPMIIPRMIAAPGNKQQPGQSMEGGLSMVRMGFSIAVVFLLSTSISMCSGYLVNSIVDEKTNRTMEILVTSVSPHQLMLGKLFASISIGMTQVLVWIGIPLLLIVPMILNTPQITTALPQLPLMLGLFILFAIPTFLLIAALVSSASAVVADGRQGSDIVSVVMINFMLAALLYPIITSHPDGVIAMLLSFFPLTAYTTMMLRISQVIPPTWQLVVSFSILLLSSVGALWFSGWVFRWGMLRYGQTFRLKDLWEQRKLR